MAAKNDKTMSEMAKTENICVSCKIQRTLEGHIRKDTYSGERLLRTSTVSQYCAGYQIMAHSRGDLFGTHMHNPNFVYNLDLLLGCEQTQ